MPQKVSELLLLKQAQRKVRDSSLVKNAPGGYNQCIDNVEELTHGEQQH